MPELTELERELVEALRLAVNTLNACDGPSHAERSAATGKARRALAHAKAAGGAE